MPAGRTGVPLPRWWELQVNNQWYWVAPTATTPLEWSPEWIQLPNEGNIVIRVKTWSDMWPRVATEFEIVTSPTTEEAALAAANLAKVLPLKAS